jgi:hypothetical protein
MNITAQKDQLMKELAGCQDVLFGSLVGRMMQCGKKGCRCHRDPEYRHGPLYYLSDNQGGKTRWVYVRKSQVEEVRESLERGRRAEEILRELAELKRMELGLGKHGRRKSEK